MTWTKLERLDKMPPRGKPASAALEMRGDRGHAKLVLWVRKTLVDDAGGPAFSVMVGAGREAGRVRLVPDPKGIVTAVVVRRSTSVFRLGRIASLPSVHTGRIECEVEVVDHEGGRRAVEVRLPDFAHHDGAALGRRSGKPGAAEKKRGTRPPRPERPRTEQRPQAEPVEPAPVADAPEPDPHEPPPVVKRQPGPEPLRRSPPPVAQPSAIRGVQANADLVPPVERFTGPTGITVDVANNSVEFGQKAAKLTPRGVRLVAALANLKHGQLLGREVVSLRIWQRRPASYDVAISQIIPEVNFALENIGLVVRSTRGIGLCVDVL